LSTYPISYQITVDGASEAADEFQGLGQGLQQTSEEADNANTGLNLTSTQMAQVATVGAGLATGVGSLAIGFGNLHDQQLQVADSDLKLANAHNALDSAQLTVQHDQEALTAAIAKYGADSPQAATASDTLTKAQNSLATAQDNLTSATNRDEIAHHSLQNSQIQLALQGVSMAAMLASTLIPMFVAETVTMADGTVVTGVSTAAKIAHSVASGAEAIATGVATAAQGLFNAVMDANPIMLVVLAIAGLVAVIGYLTDGFRNFQPLMNDFNKAWQDLKPFLDDVWNALKPIIQAIEDLANNPAVKGIISALSSVGSAVGGALSSIGLASGGIITQPTYALVGEAGPEAVIPISSTSDLSTSLSSAIPAVSYTANAPSAPQSSTTISLPKMMNVSDSKVADSQQEIVALLEQILSALQTTPASSPLNSTARALG
jgi:hypothetical protein